MEQVCVYACNVANYTPDFEWRTRHTQIRHMHGKIEIPDQIGQRVEVISGDLIGSKGYATGWNEEGIIMKMYLKCVPGGPPEGKKVSPKQLVTVRWQDVGRSYQHGDMVLKRGESDERMFIHYEQAEEDDKRPEPFHPAFLPVVHAVYEAETFRWVIPYGIKVVTFVAREELSFGRMLHDPDELDERWSNPYRTDWDVTVTKGPWKGYHGRVRSVRAMEVEVELEAVQRVEKFQPTQLHRRV